MLLPPPQNNVVHGDLSTSNVMISVRKAPNGADQMIAKVGDL